MGYGAGIAIAALVGAALGAGSAAARGAERDEIIWSGLGGAALGAATSGAGTAIQAGGQGAQAGGQAAAQGGQAASQASAQGASAGAGAGATGGAASGAAGGAASGAGSAALGTAGQESAKQATSNMLLKALEESSKEAATEGAGTGLLGAAEAEGGAIGAFEGLSAPNVAGMEAWPSIPQYMRYGGSQGGMINKANYLATGAYNYPGVQQGIQGGRYASSATRAISAMQPPTLPPRLSMMGPQMQQGKSYGIDWYKKQSQQQAAARPEVGSALGQGFNPEDPYGRRNRESLWNSYY